LFPKRTDRLFQRSKLLQATEGKLDGEKFLDYFQLDAGGVDMNAGYKKNPAAAV
jgi:hypothetical protein